MYHYQRRYTGPLQAVILDLAGTCVDFGSLAPIQAFIRLFANEGLELTEAEARGPMGTEKSEHIRRLLALPRIAQAWLQEKGAEPNEQDVARLYAAFVPLQLVTIRDRAHLIPGTCELIDYCADEAIALGVNTGYNREMVQAMQASLAEQGLRPASIVCAPEVPKGRPWPHMSLKNAMELEVSAVQGCVKCDDTVMGIEEGLNAGMWSVGFAISGNALGIDQPTWEALDESERAGLRERAYQRLQIAGAHYVVDSIADLPWVLDEIADRLASGEQP